MKKRIPFMLMLSMVILVLCACAGGEKKSSDDNLEQEEENKEVLSQFAEDDGTTWKDSWMEKTASGDSIQVDINASVVIPSLSRMSTVEVSKYDFSNENKKHVAEAVFDGEIYYGDVEKLPKSELKSLLGEAREDLQESYENWQGNLNEQDSEENDESYKADIERNLEKKETQVERYEELVRNAPDEYVRIQGNDYQGERYIGERDGIQYSLDFADQSIWISPLVREDIFPDKVKGAGDYVSYFPKQKDEKLDNECEMERKDAEQLARDFTRKLGFSELVLKETRDLVWDVPQNGRLSGGERFADGWSFSFAAGVDDVAFDSFGVEGDDIYRVGHEEYQAEKKYSLYCSMNICVTDRGVIEANYYNPIEIQSVTPGVKLLSLKNIKQIIRNSMGEYAGFFIDKGKRLVGAIRFSYLELVYYRLSDPDNEDRFTYIPAWRLRRDGNQQLYYIVNAMDGSVIRDWESTWNLSEDWLY